MSFKAHLFVCTNAPDKAHKCGSKGADDLRKRLKDRCKQEFGKSVRVSSAGCMGKCEDGIACVIYPQNQWFLKVEDRGRDEDLIFEAVREAVRQVDHGTDDSSDSPIGK